jgi:hypothetical protein
MNKIYWERQRGGLCRLHSINAYFGKPVYSTDDFWNAADEFDALQQNRFNTTTSCRQFDLVNSDQRNLVSYILSKHGIYTRYIASNNQKDQIEDAIKSTSFFVYNEGHIWIMSKLHGQWYKIDSIGGVILHNPESLRHEKNIGIIIPIHNKHREFMRLSKKMQDLTTPSVEQFLRKQHAAKNIMGNLETTLGAIMEILSVQIGERDGFAYIKNLIVMYNTFIKQLCTGRYNDLEFLLKHVISIVSSVDKVSALSERI